MTPTAGNVERLLALGATSMSLRVADRLERLGPAATALARAAAVLAHSPIALAVSVADLPVADALGAADDLAGSGFLKSSDSTQYAHPLIRAAVDDATPSAVREHLHRRAAEQLMLMATDPEVTASHLLHTQPDRESDNASITAALAHAADAASWRGAPGTACTYLQRALREPATPEARRQLLGRLGSLSMAVDLSQAETYLSECLALAEDPAERAMTAYLLGFVLVLGNRSSDSIDVQRDVIDWLSAADTDQRQVLLAGIGTAITSDPQAHAAVAGYYRQIIAEPPGDGFGARSLDCLVAWFRYLLCDDREQALLNARRALSDPVFRTAGIGTLSWLDAAIVLAAGNLKEAGAVYDDAIAVAHQRGSLTTTAMLLTFRGQYWQWRGALADACADGREAAGIADLINLPSMRPAVAFWIVTLLEQGLLAEAKAVLGKVTQGGRPQGEAAWWYLIWAESRVFAAEGRWAMAAQTALLAGAEASQYGWVNSPIVVWRLDAACALSKAGRVDEARHLAQTELSVATQWGEARALGAALRVCAQVNPGPDIDMLERSVAVLEGYGAELELAKSRIMLGEALAARGHTESARRYLQEGWQGAATAGATPLATDAVAALRRFGLRPRRVNLTGPGALSPSEDKVARLAVNGATNREIAQELFLTTKTIETHLTAIYRKLRIAGRPDLAHAMRRPPVHGVHGAGDGNRTRVISLED